MTMPCRLSLLTLLALAGCPRKVPDHLRIDPPRSEANADVPVTDAASALRALVGADPLVRSPELLDAETLQALSDAEPMIEFVEEVRALERGEGQAERAMQQLEEAHPRSAAVPLSRGYRLRVVENLLGNMALPEAQRNTSILALITPLRATSDDATLNRGALDWLVAERSVDPIVRAYAERWVLTGWLADPGLYLAPAAEALEADMYDGLSRSPTAAILVARHRGDTADTAAPLAALERATQLALEKAAADRDREQGAWAEHKKDVAEELGEDDPIHALLSSAATGFTAAAADDLGAGGALLALSAMRWRGRCDDAPCAGVDRVHTMGMARRFDPRLDALGHTWQVLALKEALDTMDVAHDTVMFSRGALEVLDAVLGTGGGPLDDQLLRKRRPDASLWLSLARAVGEEGVTDWEGARAALGRHLKREADAAAARAPDEQAQDLLQRISSRAIP